MILRNVRIVLNSQILFEFSSAARVTYIIETIIRQILKRATILSPRVCVLFGLSTQSIIEIKVCTRLMGQ